MTRGGLGFLLVLAALVTMAVALERFGAAARAASASAAPHAPDALESADRRLAAAAAGDEFLALHFFADGRGMHQVPELIRAYEPVAPLFDRPLLERRWGFVLERGRPVGLLRADHRGITVGVAGCALCHSGRAAGRFVPGLGNKNVDVTQTARDVRILARGFMPLPLDPRQFHDWRTLRRQSIGFADRLADPRHGNFTQGLVPLAFIRQWLYETAGRTLPPDPRHASVKVPALWGYGLKRAEGSFCDGLGEGVGWAAAVELAAGQRAETVRGYAPRLEHAEDVIAAFLPPPYPYAVDHDRAARGGRVFAERCARCHGAYARDDQGLPRYAAPRFVPLDSVGTDDARLASNTPDFYQVVATNPLGPLLTVHHTERGYFAPRLDGIWSRFPYLHNGSVPSLAAMLTPPARRPLAFSLAVAGEERRFDRERVGLTMPAAGSVDELELVARGRRGARDVYFVERPGHSRRGHPFGTGLEDRQKQDLIEYLKTL